MKLLRSLEKSTHFWFLLTTCTLFFFLRLPSLFEPYWYGDEGINEVIGYSLRHGRMLYSGIWDNKPPLLYLTYSLFSGDQFAAKLLSLIAGLFAVIIFYFLAKKIFENNRNVLLTTALFAFLFAIPLLEGNIANAENFMLVFILLAAYFIWNKTDGNSTVTHFLAGFLLSIAFLFKIVAIFDLGAFSAFILIIHYKNIKHFSSQVISLFPLILGFTVPIGITAMYFFIRGTFGDFLNGSLIQNVGYVGYGNMFIIPQGLLIAKIIVLLATVLLLLYCRINITKQELFIYLWTAFSLFDTFFSQRPYTHYILMLLCSFSLLFGLLIWKKAKQKIAFFVIAAIIVLITANFHFYGKTISYYVNFISYVTGQASTTTYESFFDTITTRDYAVAGYLKTHVHPNDSVFVWGNSGQIYILSATMPPGRFVVAYHITVASNRVIETKIAIAKAKPKYIVVLQNAPAYPYSLFQYNQKINIENGIIYERTF